MADAKDNGPPAVGWVVVTPDHRGDVRVSLLHDSLKPTTGEGTTLPAGVRFYKVTDRADMNLSLAEIKTKFVKMEDFARAPHIEIVPNEPIFTLEERVEKALEKRDKEHRKAPVPEVDKRWRNGTPKGADDGGHL